MQVVQLEYPLLSKQFDSYLKGYVVGFNLETGRPLIEAIDPLAASHYRGNLERLEVDKVSSF
jgi:hypothetical protein